MSSRKRYRSVTSFERLNFSQLCREIDRTPAQTRKVIRRAERLGMLRPRIRGKRTAELTYDAVEVEVIKAMISVPYRPAPQPRDWLNTYLQGSPDARPGEPQPPGST